MIDRTRFIVLTCYSPAFLERAERHATVAALRNASRRADIATHDYEGDCSAGAAVHRTHQNTAGNTIASMFTQLKVFDLGARPDLVVCSAALGSNSSSSKRLPREFRDDVLRDLARG
jgi:hypothetical protein